MLLEHGLSTKDMIVISFKAHEQMLKGLEEGQSLGSLLADHAPKAGILSVLMQAMKLKDALKVYDNMEKSSARLWSTLAKNAAYPMFLYVFSYGMLVFFSTAILPSMQVYGSDSMALFWISWLKNLFGITNLALVVLTFCVLYILLAKKPPRKLFVLLCRLPVFSRLYSCQFAALFSALLSAGLSSEEVISLLEQCKSIKSVQFYVPALHAGLLKGKDLYTALAAVDGLDASLLYFVKTGLYTSRTAPMLTLYFEQSLQKLEETIKKLSLSIQLFSYTAVGFLVITVYQVMLMPLNMLSSF